jgi:hypothetical protein
MRYSLSRSNLRSYCCPNENCYSNKHNSSDAYTLPSPKYRFAHVYPNAIPDIHSRIYSLTEYTDI